MNSSEVRTYIAAGNVRECIVFCSVADDEEILRTGGAERRGEPLGYCYSHQVRTWAIVRVACVQSTNDQTENRSRRSFFIV